MPWQRASHARGAWASEEKSLWEVARILTGRYSYAHADGGTHAGACLLPGTVDPIRICPVAAKQPPGRQQRHHHHLRVTQRLSSQSYQPGHLTQVGLCTSGPHRVCARIVHGRVILCKSTLQGSYSGMRAMCMYCAPAGGIHGGRTRQSGYECDS